MPDMDRYCLYCQREFTTVNNLYRHIIRMHKGTWAYWRVVPAEFLEQHDLMEQHDS